MTTAKHRLWTKKVKNAIRKDSVFDLGVQGSGFRVQGSAGEVRRQILRLSSHCSTFTLSNIRHFTPLRMTKCAAEYRWWRCPKVAFQ